MPEASVPSIGLADASAGRRARTDVDLPSAADGQVIGQATLPMSMPVRYYILVLLMLASAMSIIDRQILSILIEPIRHDLGLSDTGMGFLTGAAFSAIYTITCFPVARLADSWSRSRMVAIAITIWSLMTMLCGAATSATALFLARLGVGAGEAGATAPTHALVGDLFPRSRRGTAMSVLMLCVPIGMGLGLAAGGWVLQHHGWRTTFVVAGIPGLVIAALIAVTCPRVPKGMADGLRDTRETLPFVRTLRVLVSIRSLVCLMLGAMLSTATVVGLQTWLPAFLVRSHHLGQAAIGAGLGAALGVGALVGSVAGGPLADWLGRFDLRWHFWLPLLSIPLSGLLAAIALFSPPAAIWPLIGGEMLLSSLFAGPALAIAMNLAPIRARALAAACMAVVVNSMGLAIGPQVVGGLSDLLRPAFGDQSLQFALLAGTALTLPSAWLFWLGSRTYRSDLAKAEALSIN